MTGGALRLNAPVDADVAGLVTAGPVYLRNARISVGVDVATSTPGRAGIIIGQSKVTATTPEAIQNCLRITLSTVANTMSIIQDVAGAEITLYNGAWTDGSGTLVLDIEPDSVFKIYEDTTLRYVGNLPFTNATNQGLFTNHIYLYAVAVGAAVGYALLDNFQLDLDVAPMDEVGGSGVAKTANYERVPVIGRLMDQSGLQTTFQTDTPITGTPSQRIILSRDVKQFRIEEIRYYMNAANAVTSQFFFWEEANADDDISAMKIIYQSIAALTDSKPYRASSGSHLATGDAVAANDTVLPVTARLERMGQLWFGQGWSGAPGATKGSIVVIGKEVD